MIEFKLFFALVSYYFVMFSTPGPNNAMLTASEKKELADLEEGKKHGNSKIYDKCWKGCTKVAGKKRGEPGSCKCD